ncbi:phosphodiester glycosidase family protein [Luteolibacter flavescens]|uniref:Phosphodiester glycosidase family protein n=1 Tax=Luteolibacter flavescens TaxID=1859460 RepID=A0ABT3FJQ5_9BACT|nr:phosphodiester glycosidase family protein [Luteolibacter flavescens]MCW1883589.1 phosphodiester glycosidase family protein [Luteolibacter flavescens]
MKRLLLLLSACMLPATAAPEKKIIDGVTYHLLSAKPSQIRMVWKDAKGGQIETFPQAVAHLASEKETPETIMNGGIYEPGGIPSGLLIQDGRELTPLNPRNGKGNFFLKPNGIFLIGDKGAAVIDTTEYPPAGVKVTQAVQSGPLLLRRGIIHPEFRAGSPNRLHRNGIGVAKDGTVVLAMTDIRSPKYPNLHEFAKLFADLGCEDALFLDGDISQMRSGEALGKPSGPFGSFIAVVKEVKPADEAP